jgi:FO synthase
MSSHPIDQSFVDDLLTLPLDELMLRARNVRDAAHGTRVTFSPKVFIPLTMLCRDKCGYCTFAQPPARLEKPYMTAEDVLAIARQGARTGCQEALFTLGERPEERYEIAANWLRDNGYDSTVHYLHDMAKLVLDETGLLPHANAGALYNDELAMLRRVSPSQGMMLESLRDDLECHRGAPDKEPQRRINTLCEAGELAIPFTSGILVGIGEKRRDRIEALALIAATHAKYGHVQEVIVQNFLPKAGTAMHKAKPCPEDEYLWSIAVARLILPASIHLQAPPNLSDDFGILLDAGIDDWGGVSPVTADHVNPERPWPALDRLGDVTEDRGMVLAPRLTIYPEFAMAPEKWLDPALHFPVMDRTDAEGLGRDDPGAFWPEKVTAADVVHDGAEVVLVGHKSTQWYSGSNGQELGEDEVVALFAARGPEVGYLADYADELRFKTVGNNVTWVHNRNINYTNVCTYKCKFCGFSKGPLSLNLRGTPYLLTLDDIADRAVEAAGMGATEVTLQGGIHPDFDGDYYIDVTKAVKSAVPDMHVHGFTALEVTEGAHRNGESLREYLLRLKEAGLASLPGTAAEILDDDIRAIICSDKVNTEEWLECHRQAHSIGLHSNITIMFGSVEHPRSWAKHMVVTRELQKETGGFTEFIPLPFVHMASPIYLQRKARRGPTFRENVLMHAIGRIFYHGHIDNVQVSWVKIGTAGAAQLLQAGCNDLGGTLMDENISRAAGANHGQMMTEGRFGEIVAPMRRTLVQRNTAYKFLSPTAGA